MNIKKLSLDEKIGQMLCFAFNGTEVNEQLKRLIKEEKIGSIIFFAKNIENIKQAKSLTKALQDMSDIPLFIGLDQEGGMVRRIVDDITYMPGAMSLAASNPNMIYEANYSLAQNLKFLGFNVNYAPVADINNNPQNPVINSRSFGDNPQFVANCVVSSFKGSQDALVLPTVKHFPGHGDTAVDSHLGLPVVEKTYEELKNMELIPYVESINQGLEGIMISHILYSKIDDKYPSSLSYQVITKLLKEKLGFKGLITTDSLTMKAIWDKFSIEEIVLNGVNAGNDILVFCGGADLDVQLQIIATFKNLVLSGKISQERVDESVSKILKLKAKYTIANVPELIVNKKTLQLVDDAITEVKKSDLLPLKADDKVLIIFPRIKLASLVDNESNETQTLSSYLPYDEIIIDENNNEIKKIVKKVKEYDKIIMATYNVKRDDYQTEVFSVLDKEKTVLVSLRSPYDGLILSGASGYICTYDVTKESIKALSKTLKEGVFKGKLPIKLRSGENETY